MSAYERVRIGRAFSEARNFWSVHQILSSIIPGVIGAGLPFLIKANGWGLKGVSVADPKMVVLALVCGIVGCLVSWFISFVINYLWLSPAALHGEQEGQIDRLRGQVSDTPVTPAEQGQRRLVLEKMADFTAEEAKIVEALLRHGEVHRKDVGSLGFSIDLFYSAVDKGKRTALMKERDDRHGGGVEQYLSINPEFKSALQHYFTQRNALSELRPAIGILSHSEGDPVGWRENIVGFIEKQSGFVQVFVESDSSMGGRMFWNQWDVDVHGSSWRGQAQFGDEGKPGGEYQIIAIVGAKPVPKGARVSLPEDGVRSRPVRVIRTR